MNAIDEDEIRQIVQKVLYRSMGFPIEKSEPFQGEAKPAQPAAPAEVKTQDRKVVAIGADHGGFDLKETLKVDLAGMGYEVIDVGTKNKDAVDYPDFAHEVALLVSAGKAWRGIAIDGAGIGSCIVANKVPGVRAGMAYDYSSAVNSREHNDTNVLTLGAGLIGVNLAKQIVSVWMATQFGGGRHERRIQKITAIENQHQKK